MPANIHKFLIELRKNAIKYERVDINGIEKSFFLGRYSKRVVCGATSIAVVYNLNGDFSRPFVAYASTVISILTGLFVTALIFSFDKFYQKKSDETKKFEIEVNTDNSAVTQRILVAFKEIDDPDSRQKLWRIQSYNYAKQFAYITGYNIILCVGVLFLLSFSALFEKAASISPFTDYYVDIHNITTDSVLTFTMVVFILLQRFFVLYWICGILYNTLYIVSSLVNFMTVKIDRNDD